MASINDANRLYIFWQKLFEKHNPIPKRLSEEEIEAIINTSSNKTNNEDLNYEETEEPPKKRIGFDTGLEESDPNITPSSTPQTPEKKYQPN